MDCHGARANEHGGDRPVVLVGNPNVGKSVLFGRLTGRYTTVSNFPGTTVELSTGTLALNGHRRPVIDTPGLQSLLAQSDDERVARDIVLDGHGATLLVADAKNLRRALLLAIELGEVGTPFVLAVNMSDEAHERGISIDAPALSEHLGLPVVPTVATTGSGVDELVAELEHAACPSVHVVYPEAIVEAVARVAAVAPGETGGRGGSALLLLAGDRSVVAHLGIDDGLAEEIAKIRDETASALGCPVTYAVNRARLAAADRILSAVTERGAPRRRPAEALGRLMQHRLWGWPILLAILVAMYAFVGWLGAGVLVGWLEDVVFGRWINPLATRVADVVAPFDVLHDFLVGEYGLVTMALTYGFAIVLPIVVTFFLAFGVLEDSGYLPRLAVMLDRMFRVMGLNGRAVIPMVLGLGCDTMATVTTRTLETRRERIQVTLLLALAVPCSAQLGVILGMITKTGLMGIAIWTVVVLSTLLGVGWLAARVLPGERSDFIVELPPLRVPSVRNVAVKTAARLEWYLKEVVPVFVLGTAALFVLDRVGALQAIERWFSPVVVGWLGLPAAATGVFLIGFLRRDYGAAGLFALAGAGAMSGRQMLVAIVVITLFVPCIANLMMIVKEHGRRVAFAVAAFVFPFAVIVGGALNAVLSWLGIEVG
jgi:ferrous iron transport protein B